MAPGLGQSTPLVTIPVPTTISKGGAVPAGNDHPLAAPAQPQVPAMIGISFLPQSMSAVMTTPTKSGNASNNSSPRPTYASQSNSTVIAPAPVSPPKSLESFADAFLSQPSYRTQQLGLAPILRPPPLPREEGVQRLRTLVVRRAWGDVLKIATTVLNAPNGQHAAVYSSLVMLPLNAPKVDVSRVPPNIREETVEIMTLQCNAWLKLRRYADLATEVERWNFLAHNDAAAQPPEWLPWSLHILAGQIQLFTDDSERSSDVLFEIRDRIPSEDAIWMTSVENALANMFLRQSRWRLALGSLDRILDLIPSATKQYVASKYPKANNKTELEKCLMAAFRCEIMSRQGRILLNVGALTQVGGLFEAARETWHAIDTNSIPPALIDHQLINLIPVQEAMNEGLLDFAKSDFDKANVAFSKAADCMRAIPAIKLRYDPDDWMGPIVVGCETPNIVYSECINNMALCGLYTCRLKDAVELLEGVIREDPGAFLTERTAFNLCTLYELGADSAISARRKRVLQLIAKRFFLHDIGPESFRVN